MGLQVGYDHRITLEFSNTANSKDLNNFADVMRKCYKEAKKSGFRNMFTRDEREFIRSFYETLTGQVADQESVTSDRKTIEE